jgi:hypothetical protein
MDHVAPNGVGVDQPMHIVAQDAKPASASAAPMLMVLRQRHRLRLLSLAESYDSTELNQ